MSDDLTHITYTLNTVSKFINNNKGLDQETFWL